MSRDVRSHEVVHLLAEEPALGLGAHVRRLRLVTGLSQGELAERLGTTQSAIARLESGRQEPTMASLRRLAIALECQFVVRVAPAVAA